MVVVVAVLVTGVVAGTLLHLWVGGAHRAIVDQRRRPDQATLCARMGQWT
jgi:hypothetical protein